ECMPVPGLGRAGHVPEDPQFWHRRCSISHMPVESDLLFPPPRSCAAALAHLFSSTRRWRELLYQRSYLVCATVQKVVTGFGRNCTLNPFCYNSCDERR